MNNWINIEDNHVFSYWNCPKKCPEGLEVITPNMIDKTKFPLVCPKCKAEMKYFKTIINVETK
jgi:hypothetical protein